MLFLYINPYGQSLSLSATQLHILLPFPLCRSLPALCCSEPCLVFSVSVTHCLMTHFQQGQRSLIHQNSTSAHWQVFAMEQEQLPWLGIQLCPLGLEYPNTPIPNAPR